MSRILIAGGAGFLGSHLCDLFWNRGFEVICVDNLITGNARNVQHLMDQNRFTYLHHDIIQVLEVDQDLDYVLNFASPASPPDYYRLPIQTMLVGSTGTHNLLELAKEKSAIFMMASTSEIYGDPQVSPQLEDYWGNVNPVGPRSVYDEAKRFSEAMTMAYHREFSLNIRLLRIFNVYGPRMRPKDGRAIPNFIDQALNGEPITIYGDGSQTRSFCYYQDEVEGIYRLLMSNLNVPINIGNPNELTILELAETIIELTGSRSQIIFQELPEDDPKVRRPDISRAKRHLDWQPVVDLRQGLTQTIDYFATLSNEN
ncbi:MAG: SDR family oxidoreductase [Candidatus Poribacteria bacterium]|jgi:dTDP-glucose 4,6-dehydratase|nr:SDR family oxidoreductase [Candidatus Poribacteria bacterium]MDP6748267.1 SDR family oxidoreductase [Candidatus Poribacteria bacterium]MDP6995274.1 SDR family oxidoreductase [Candidatus Poribacteria bacterium]MDP7279936.1 SDR family oxidoreductase [Candidatus Poribacteria bacterium]